MYQLGDFVYVKTFQMKNCLEPYWEEPFQVLTNNTVCGWRAQDQCQNLTTLRNYTHWYPTLIRPGLFWICGNKAYKTLPLDWTGTCTVGYITTEAYGACLQKTLLIQHLPCSSPSDGRTTL
uniref:Uncharacterized protein n=1 Tax=Callorhinchus milii TaxID=7868 RepID=A0A4W3KK62_CALMI